jgi:hypothetical protein
VTIAILVMAEVREAMLPAVIGHRLIVRAVLRVGAWHLTPDRM